MKFGKILKSKEFRLIFIISLIIIIGLISLNSASQGPSTEYSLLKKQIAAIILGVIALALVCSLDYEFYLRYWFIFYAGCIGLLVAVLFTKSINNARSWFTFKEIGVAFQPSELVKIVIIIMCAKFLAELKRVSMSSKNKTKKIFILGILLTIPIGLILIQPDFGTAMVIVVSVLSMIFVAGVDLKYIKYAVISFLAIAPITFFFFLKEGQKERILVFLNPSRDPTGSGYHVIQSKIAIGSGMLGGEGLFNGVQTQLGYLYAQTTDFIFAAIAEEMGFIVAAFLIILLILMISLSLKIAQDARDEEGKLMVVGIATMFTVHIIINIGMTMGLVPVTGIPLPFISSGGSSMLTNLIAIGLILGVSIRKTGLRF